VWALWLWESAGVNAGVRHARMKGENAETVTVHVECGDEAWSTGARRTDVHVWRQHGMTVMRRSWQCFKGWLSPTPEPCICMPSIQCMPFTTAPIGMRGQSSSCPVQVGSHTCHDINAHLIMSACLSCRSSIHRVECTESHKVILSSMGKPCMQAMWPAMQACTVHMYECRSTTTCMHAVMKDTIIWQRAMLTQCM
jgi:hypothetical protein